MIKLKYPWAPLLADLSLFSNGIIPKDYGGKTSEEFYKAPVGTGPFVWDDWTQGQYVKVVKNPDYWSRASRYLDSVTWTVVADANTRKLQLQGGQIDRSTSSRTGRLGGAEDHRGHHDEPVPLDPDRLRRVQRAAQAVRGRARAPGDRLRPGPRRHGEVGAVRQRQAGGLAALAEHAVLRQEPRRSSSTWTKAKQEMAQSSRAQRVLHEHPDQRRRPEPGVDRADHAVRAQELGITLEIKQLDTTDPSDELTTPGLRLRHRISYWTMDIPDPDEWTSFAVDPRAAPTRSSPTTTTPRSSR